MPSPVKKYFRRRNGSNGWDIIYFYTDASAVAETDSRVFVTPTQKAKIDRIATGSNTIEDGAQVNVIESIKLGTGTSEKTFTVASKVASLSKSDAQAALNVADGAQVNVIEAIKLGTGTTQKTFSISSKNATLSKADALTALNVADGAQVNVIEEIKLAGQTFTVGATELYPKTASMSASTLKSALSLNNVTNDAQVKASEKGVANGVATLDANGKLTYSQLPDVITGQLMYAGTLVLSTTSSNATGKTFDSTQSGIATVMLSSGAKSKLGSNNDAMQFSAFITNSNCVGMYLIVSYSFVGSQGSDTATVSNSTLSLGSTAVVTGTTDHSVNITTGDWLILNGTNSIGKVDNTDAVSRVAELTGDITAASLRTKLDAVGAYTPISHASSSTTYGIGTSSNYGHVKLGDSNQTGATAADGVAAPNGHTHSGYMSASKTFATSIATSSDTNELTLAHGTKYKLTAGGTSFVFTMPTDNNTDTWRAIKVNGTQQLANNVSTALDFAGAGGVSLSYSSGTITITGHSNIYVGTDQPANPLEGDIWLSDSAS